jgi:hypothetical protein
MAVPTRLFLVCVILTALIALLWTLRTGLSPTLDKVANISTNNSTSKESALIGSTLQEQCNSYPDNGNIAVIVKTGATEILDRVPTQLTSCLSCVKEPIIFSDLEQTLGSYKVRDVLAKFSPDVASDNPDFNLYRQQKALLAEGRDIEIPALRSLPNPIDDWRIKDKSAAWALDKYKFLHMIEQAWELQPDREWYVFIEADTYLSWPNLSRWLGTLNPDHDLYFGSPVQMFEHPHKIFFGYGGAGFILSRSAMRRMCVDHEGFASRYDSRVQKWFYGDFMVAYALDEEIQLHVADATPGMNPDEPLVIPFNERNWCEQVITMHHMHANQMDQVYRLEHARNFSDLRFRDVFHGTHPTGFPFKREDWDNKADEKTYALEVIENDVETVKGNFEPKVLVDPNASFINCELACIQNKMCFQFTFTEEWTRKDDGGTRKRTLCHLSKAFRLGKERLPARTAGLPGSKTWTSGWRSDRIARWIEAHDQCE